MAGNARAEAAAPTGRQAEIADAADTAAGHQETGTAEAGAGASTPGAGARAAALGSRALSGLRRHWLASLLGVAGIGLRVVAQISYHPALLYVDSVKYLYNAWPAADPLGYNAPLRGILAIGGTLGTVELVQHLLGLAMALGIYVIMLRRGAPRWMSALAIAPVLLDGYQIQMETTIMPDVWFEALIVAGIVVLLWKPRITTWTCIAAGVILGTSATVRQVGEILALPAVLFVLFAVPGWRQRLSKAVVIAVAFAVPIVAYCSVSYQETGHFWLSRNGEEATYGRVADAVDCATLKLPSYEKALCPTKKEQAYGPDWLDHNVASPLRTYVPPAGLTREGVVANFSHHALRQQPLRILKAFGKDVLKLFALTRHTAPGDTPISRWQFQSSYPKYLPTINIEGQHQIVLGLRLAAANGPLLYKKLDPSWGGPAQVWTPGAKFLRSYQLDGGYTPGPFFLFCTLIGLIGSLALLRRRTSPERRQLTLACMLFFVSAVSVLLMSDLFEYSWRYELPAIVTLPPAGLLGLAVLVRYGKRRRAERLAANPAAKARQLSAKAG